MPYITTSDGTEIYYTEQGAKDGTLEVYPGAPHGIYGAMPLTNRTDHDPLRVPTHCRGRSTDAV